MEETISISQLSFLRRFSNDYSRLGNDYACAHIVTSNGREVVQQPSLRFDGILLMLVLKGDVELAVNMERFNVPVNTLMIIPPNTPVSLHSVNADEFDIYAMQISVDFLHDINFEVNMLNVIPMSVEHRPCMTVTEEECDLLAKYVSLIHRNTLANSSPSNEMYARSISRNLMAAMLYQCMALGQRHRSDMKPDNERQRSRKLIYTHEFLRLVRENFRRERSVGFYADKLFISPKYLSLVIKNSTGRSAATWIDDYVLTEAKHMLRFSGKNIQQVAYELNFTNQSSFGKYFKHLTGMSPSEYQHS